MNVTASAVGTSRRASGPPRTAEKAERREPDPARSSGRRRKPGTTAEQPTEGWPRGTPLGFAPVTGPRCPPAACLHAVGKRAAHRSRRRVSSDLGGERSPWEERASRCWKRCRFATDSSVEKRLETRASSGAALTAAFGNGRRRRCQSLQSACATASMPGLPDTGVSSARRFHQVTAALLRQRSRAPRAKRTVFGRKRGAERTTPASLLAGDVPGTQPTAASVVDGDARDDVGSHFGDSEHHRQEARTFAPSRTSV